ncbi:S49 family peptidase [Rhodobacter capsulatus]|jgi:ClpP class serine protease|uniref:Peptidase S49 n=1 Tax=Rhodobacter phage RcapNL TaxID=1131316 RepID=H6WBK9_9CAUD|nr:S49 family peptidase [Rhodobacter capsulatus]YP_007518388.1 head maturation protease [Rhodobacter phage RcapNL]AFK66513.1 serine peptidase [Rhodobacter phage RcNL1]AFA44846.1 peptidase S49 [Rhodobacter phage RcapNL]ETD02729.1 serine peptidase [Rhodobacter capsulatus DE442]ETD78886.1 serine peptidase [Rhodobacter capsulatus R121]ETE54865.1 serine peptidase [Rhodobacter capsulatus Y262]
MRNEAAALIAAIRAQPWAIMPEYLEAIEAIAVRALDADVLQLLARDGHAARMPGNLEAVAAVGTRLDGSRGSTIRNGNAVVPMIGTIFPRASMINASTGGTSLDALMHDVRVAEASADVERIVMVIDSPGGVVSDVGAAADMLRVTTKPITAYVAGMGASLAYWLGSQASELVLDRAASVGSIGVVATTTRQEGADANGRRSYEIVSSNAPFKRPDMSSEDGRAAVQAEVDAIEAVFLADVAAGRRVTVDRVRESFGRGAMVPAARAVEVGMADRIGTLESILSQGPGRTRANTGRSRALAAAEVEMRLRAAQGV